MTRLIPGLGLLGLALAVATADVAGPKEAVPKLYVTNSAGDNIHVIDLRSFKVVGEIRFGEHPDDAAVAVGGRRFFTTVEWDHTLRVIDAAKRLEAARVKVGKMSKRLVVAGVPK